MTGSSCPRVKRRHTVSSLVCPITDCIAISNQTTTQSAPAREFILLLQRRRHVRLVLHARSLGRLPCILNQELRRSGHGPSARSASAGKSLVTVYWRPS